MQGSLEQSDIVKLIATLRSIPDADFSDLQDGVNSTDNLSQTSPGFFQNSHRIDDIFDIIDKAELDKLYAYLLHFPDGIAKARTEHGETPLHFAVRDPSPTAIRLEIIKVLLSQGGDILAKDNEGMTPLHVAAKAPFAIESLELLLANAVNKFVGARNNNFRGYADLSEILKISDNRGLTPLHYALTGGRLESIEALLLHNAPLDCRESSQNATPLLWCFRHSHLNVESLETVFALTMKFSDFQGFAGIIKVDLDATDAEGNTLLHYACGLGAHKIVQALIRFGATINNKPVNAGGKPYHLRKGDEERSKIIRGYLQNPDLAKTEDLLLPDYEPQLMNLYLNSGIVDLGEAEAEGSNNNLPLPLNSDHLSNSQAQQSRRRLRTIPNVPVELDQLYGRLKIILAELPGISAQFLEALKYLEIKSKDLLKQYRCQYYLNLYGCVYKLPESSAFINNILIIPKIRTDTDGKYSFLTMDQCGKAYQNLNSLIARCGRQLDILTGKIEIDIETQKKIERNVDKMSSAELKSAFPANDVGVIRSIYRDKPTLEIFIAGCRRKMEDHLYAKEKITKINLIFSTIQKFITVVQYVQQIFIVASQTQPQVQVLETLKSMVDQVCSNTNNTSQESVSQTNIEFKQ